MVTRRSTWLDWCCQRDRRTPAKTSWIAGRGAGQAVPMAAGAVPGVGASPLLLTTVQQVKAMSVLPWGRGGPASAHLARGRSREASPASSAHGLASSTALTARAGQCGGAPAWCPVSLIGPSLGPARKSPPPPRAKVPGTIHGTEVSTWPDTARP